MKMNQFFKRLALITFLFSLTLFNPKSVMASSICQGSENWNNYHRNWNFKEYYGNISTTRNLDNSYIEFYNSKDQLIDCEKPYKQTDGSYIMRLSRIYQTGILYYGSISPMPYDDLIFNESLKIKIDGKLVKTNPVNITWGQSYYNQVDIDADSVIESKAEVELRMLLTNKPAHLNEDMSIAAFVKNVSGVPVTNVKIDFKLNSRYAYFIDFDQSTKNICINRYSEFGIARCTIPKLNPEEEVIIGLKAINNNTGEYNVNANIEQANDTDLTNNSKTTNYKVVKLTKFKDISVSNNSVTINYELDVYHSSDMKNGKAIGIIQLIDLQHRVNNKNKYLMGKSDLSRFGSVTFNNLLPGQYRANIYFLPRQGSRFSDGRLFNITYTMPNIITNPKISRILKSVKSTIKVTKIAKKNPRRPRRVMR